MVEPVIEQPVDTPATETPVADTPEVKESPAPAEAPAENKVAPKSPKKVAKRKAAEVTQSTRTTRSRSGAITPKKIIEREDSSESETEEEEEEEEQPKKVAKKAAAPQAPALKVGDIIPEGLVVISEAEEEHDLKALFAEKPGVIFFYPKANTPGCTTQACLFRDNTQIFADKGFQVFGMSADSPTSQKNWKEKHQMTFTLLSDRSKDILALKKLGVNKGTSISRSHIVIGTGGVVLDVQYGVSPKDSGEGAKEFVENFKQGEKQEE